MSIICIAMVFERVSVESMSEKQCTVNIVENIIGKNDRNAIKQDTANHAKNIENNQEIIFLTKAKKVLL